MPSYNVDTLQSLFLSKLEEKYGLSERALKKAFGVFDKDGNGLLDLGELESGFALLLNGVSKDDVRMLVQKYDLNGDGKISYEELLYMCTTKGSIHQDPSQRPASMRSSSSRSNHNHHLDIDKKVERAMAKEMEKMKELEKEKKKTASERVRELEKELKKMSMSDADRRGNNRHPRRDDRSPSQNPPVYNNFEDEVSDQGSFFLPPRPPPPRAGGGGVGERRSKDPAHPPSPPPPPPPAPFHLQQGRRKDSIAQSEIESIIDFTNPRELEYRAKIHLQAMKASLLRKANEMRSLGKVKDRLTMSTSELFEVVACKLLMNEFLSQDVVRGGDAPLSPNNNYNNSSSSARRRNKKDQDMAGAAAAAVDYLSFCEIIEKFSTPGTPPLRSEVKEFIFDLCVMDTSTTPRRAEATELIHLVFGAVPAAIMSSRRHQAREMAASPTRAGVASVPGVNAEAVVGFIDKFEAGRDKVGVGPFKAPRASEDNKIKNTDKDKDDQVTLSAVPLRFLSQKCKNALVAPSNFDHALVKRSATEPVVDCVREFVFGMGTSIMSGAMINVVPTSATSSSGGHVVSSSSSVGGGSSSSNNNISSSSHNNNNNNNYSLARVGSGLNTNIVYGAGSLGIVHNLAANTQTFFEGHDSDITCITVSSDGRYAATGCAGKKPYVCVWEVASPQRGPLVTIGSGFFARFVSGVAFSFDAKYVTAISGDDSNMVGVFDVASGRILCEATGQHGLAPQIKDMIWSSSQVYCDYITKEHSGLCDLIVTAGEHHIKVWSFRRPQVPTKDLGGIQDGSLVSRNLTIGKMNVKPSKTYTCCAFIPCADKSLDVVAGGSNGYLYLFRKTGCIAATAAIRGGVLCLQVFGEKVVCGGAGGVVRVCDARTLSIFIGCTVGGGDGSAMTRPVSATSAAASVASSSASRQRPSSSASTGKPSGGGAAGGGVGGGINNNNNNNNATIGDIKSIACIAGPGRGPGQTIHILAISQAGKMSRIEVSNATGPSTGTVRLHDVFHFHTGDVYGLATESSRGGRMIATVGDDRKLCVWDSLTRTLVCKTTLIAAARCVHIDATSTFFALGTSTGSVSVYVLSVDNKTKTCGLSEAAYRKDFKEETSDIKFSPNNEMICAGSHDNTLCVYTCSLNTDAFTCTLRPLHRLRGHSSYITHLDWSLDSRLIQSTCGAYELLYWEASTGKQYTAHNTSDCKWKTQTCILGFNIMGIWPPYSDGTDINAVDVCTVGVPGGAIVATGNDSDKVKILNYPSVVKNAAGKEYGGHSSHVTNVRFLHRRGGGGGGSGGVGGEIGESGVCLTSVGGRDCILQLWRLDDSARVRASKQQVPTKAMYTNAL